MASVTRDKLRARYKFLRKLSGRRKLPLSSFAPRFSFSLSEYWISAKARKYRILPADHPRPAAARQPFSQLRALTLFFRAFRPRPFSLSRNSQPTDPHSIPSFLLTLPLVYSFLPLGVSYVDPSHRYDRRVYWGMRYPMRAFARANALVEPKDY